MSNSLAIVCVHVSLDSEISRYLDRIWAGRPANPPIRNVTVDPPSKKLSYNMSVNSCDVHCFPFSSNAITIPFAEFAVLTRSSSDLRKTVFRFITGLRRFSYSAHPLLIQSSPPFRLPTTTILVVRFRTVVHRVAFTVAEVRVKERPRKQLAANNIVINWKYMQQRIKVQDRVDQA